MKIFVHGRRGCKQCKQLKKLLEQLNVKFTYEIDCGTNIQDRKYPYVSTEIEYEEMIYLANLRVF